MEENKEKTDKRYKWGDISKSDLVRVELPSGNHLELLRADDMYFPLQIENGNYVPDIRLNLPRIQQMKAREDDILICAYPRAGTHLTFEIVNMLVRGQAEYIKEDKDMTELELHFPEEFDDLLSPRIFSTHFEFHHIPQDMINKKCKIIHVQRNPKSVAVSFYLHYKSISDDIQISWEDYIFLFTHEYHPFMSWYRSTLNWEHAKLENPSLPIFPLYYENLKKKMGSVKIQLIGQKEQNKAVNFNPCHEIRRLAQFLEVKYDDDLIQGIAEKYQFENMKNAKVNLRVSEIQKMDKDVGFVKDKDKWIHAVSNVLYRKGDVDDWKNWFTVAQNEEFDKIFNEKMKHSKLMKTFV